MNKLIAIWSVLILANSKLWTQVLSPTARFSQEIIESINASSTIHHKGSGIQRITLINQTDLTLDIKCNFNGYKDRKYEIKAYALDRNKHEMSQISCPFELIPAKEDTVVLKMNAHKLIKSRNKVLISEFIRITITSNTAQSLYDTSDQIRDDVYLFTIRKMWVAK